MTKKGKGWYNDKPQHQLAGHGIPTKVKKTPKSHGKSDDRFWLDKEAQIYIPSTSDTDDKITDEEFRQRIKKAQKDFTEKFGGTTTFIGDGTYVSEETGDTIKEDVAIMEVHMTEEDWKKNKDLIFRWLEKWQEKWGQEAISFEFEGNLTFVS